MQTRVLGRTGLRVGALGLGTVSLGTDYGIAAAGEFGRPTDREAIATLHAAADGGIEFFDTAPAYGESEQLLGRAFGGRRDVVVATKLTPGGDTRASVEHSLRALRRDALDVVQVHNATVELVERGDVAATLAELRTEGKVRFTGASVYTEAEALAVIRSGAFDILQVAYNLLDRRMAERVFPAARAAGVGLVLRSAFLKGVLTSKAESLPPALAPLRTAALRARDALGGTWSGLTEAALRFCLAEDAVVLNGARTTDELNEALRAVALGPAMAPGELALLDEPLLDPALWPVA